MAIPAGSEQAAKRIARVGAELDSLIVAHIVDGRSMPRPSQFAERVRGDIAEAVTLALIDLDSDVSDEVIAAAVAEAVTEAVALYRRAYRDAQTRRRRIVRADPTLDDDDDRRFTLSALPRLARRYGFPVALAAALLTRSRIPRERIRQAAAAARDPIPPRLAAVLRASVRTKAAELRNMHAADLLDQRGDGWALYIRDALIGDDEGCVEVDRRWATAEWLRRHPVEHPNCTREGRPRRLPEGARVTLLR